MVCNHRKGNFSDLLGRDHLIQDTLEHSLIIFQTQFEFILLHCLNSTFEYYSDTPNKSTD
jgi:hypothetical protein